MPTAFSSGGLLGAYVSVILLLGVLASVGSVVTFIIIVVANRAEPDLSVTPPSSPPGCWRRRP